jgi:hypothetical protein
MAIECETTFGFTAKTLSVYFIVYLDRISIYMLWCFYTASGAYL